MPATWKDIVAHPYFSAKSDEDKLRIAENYFSKNFDTNPSFKEKTEKDPEYRPRVWENFVSKAIPKERWETKESEFVAGIREAAATHVRKISDALAPAAENAVSVIKDTLGGTKPTTVEPEKEEVSPAPKVEPSISAATPEKKGFFEKILRPSDELTPEKKARATNIMALSGITGLPPSFIEQNYDAVTKEVGVRGTPTTEELVGVLMGIAISAGMVSHPAATAAGLLRYGFVKEAESVLTQTVKGEQPELFEGREAKELIGPLREPLQGAVEVAEVVGPAMVAGGKLPKFIADSYWYRKLTIKERGLVRMTVDQMKASGMTEGEIARIRPEEWKKSFEKRLLPPEPKPPLVENASAESAASMEAIRRVQSEAKTGRQRVRIDVRSGKETPIVGVEGVDAEPSPFEIIIQKGIGKEGESVLLSQGKNVSAAAARKFLSGPPEAKVEPPPAVAPPATVVEPAPSAAPAGEARPAITPVVSEEAISYQIDDLRIAMMSWEPPQLIVDEATGTVKRRSKSTYPKWFKQVFPNDSLTIVMSAIQKWQIGGDEVLGKKEARIIRTIKDMASDAEAAGENLGQESIRSTFSAEFRLAGAVDEIIGDVAPSAGLSIRPVDVVIGKPGYTEADYRFGNEETESRYVAAHGIPKQPVTERARVFLSSLHKKATREYEHLARTAEFAPLRTALLKLSHQKGVSSDRVVRAMQGITIRMDKTRMGLFERKVLLDDLAYEVERGHGLPFGFDAETLKAEHSKISGLTAKDPVVSDALAKRKEFNDSVRHDYIKAMKDIGVDVSRKFGNEKYFRHQVLEYANLRGISGAGKKLKTPDSRGFLKRRSGSLRDINTNYLEAEYEVFAQLLHDIEVAKTIRVVDEDYNAIDTLKAEAKKQGVEWQDVIPEGYRLWQPKQGNVFYLADTIPAKLAEKLRDGALEEIGITEEDLSKVLAVGGKRRQFVVKNEVADTLENLVKIRPASVLLNMDRQALKGWKVWQLISPRRFLKYNFRNLTGDADAAFVGSPSIFKKVPQAVRELYQVFAGDKGMTPEMREWFKRGGFETTLQAQEMDEINKFRIFEHIRKEKESIANLPARAFKAYWRKARLATDFRESVLRYAAYLDYLEQRTSGKMKNYGASIPEEIDAIKDHRDAAFTMSNQLLGAYDQVSVMGRSLREHIIPFWSWKEVNFKRYIQLAKNAAANDGLAEAVGRKALGTLAKSPYTAWRVGKFLISATAFWSMLQAWNHLRFPDEEDELDVNTRNRPHIILGRDKDGKIINFTNLGALGDFLAWFGLDAAPLHVSNWFQGKRTLKEIAIEMAQSPVNVVVQGASPLIRQPSELLTKKSLFPDAFRPTMIRDRGYFMAKSVGLEHEYAALAGLPSEGYNKSLMNFFVYTSDPGRNAYGDILSEKHRFLKKINKGGEGSFMSPKSNALYNFKLAARFGDEDAKKKYLAEYGKMGGTPEGMSASLQNMSPLSGLTRQEQVVFVSQLTGEDKKKMVRAMHFYVNVLLGGKKKQKGE